MSSFVVFLVCKESVRLSAAVLRNAIDGPVGAAQDYSSSVNDVVCITASSPFYTICPYFGIGL